MKPPQFFITLILSAVGLLLSVLVSMQSQSLYNMQTSFSDEQIKIQNEFQDKQGQINRGNQFGQVYTNMIKDIASLAYDATGKPKDERLKDLLTKNNITVNVPTPAPAAATPRP